MLCDVEAGRSKVLLWLCGSPGAGKHSVLEGLKVLRPGDAVRVPRVTDGAPRETEGPDAVRVLTPEVFSRELQARRLCAVAFEDGCRLGIDVHDIRRAAKTGAKWILARGTTPEFHAGAALDGITLVRVCLAAPEEVLEERLRERGYAESSAASLARVYSGRWEASRAFPASHLIDTSQEPLEETISRVSRLIHLPQEQTAVA